MIITLGEDRDSDIGTLFDGEEYHRDWLVLVVYGDAPEVKREVRDGDYVRSFLEETARSWFYLKPFGKYGADPFPEEDEDNPSERTFDFHAIYEKRGEDRNAVVSLTAFMDDPISWSVRVTVNDVEVALGEMKRIDREIGSTSLEERFGAQKLTVSQ